MSKPLKFPEFGPTPLITLPEYEMMWEVLTTLLDAGAFEHDPDLLKKYETLQEKLGKKAKVKESSNSVLKRA